MNDLYKDIFSKLAKDYDNKTKDNWQSPIIIKNVLLKYINKNSRYWNWNSTILY